MGWVDVVDARPVARWRVVSRVMAATAVLGALVAGPAGGAQAAPAPPTVPDAATTVSRPTPPPPEPAPDLSIEAFSRRRAPRLAVIGDSITNISHDALHAAFDRDFGVSVDGRSGYTIAQQLPTAERYADSALDPATVVINLGQNDAFATADLGSANAAMRALIGQFPYADCIVLTTVNGNTFSPEWNAWANDFNFWVLFALAVEDDRVRLADWNSLVADYYAAGQPDGELTSDLVHPTALGAQRLVGVTAGAVHACPD
jgi:lysophospholipase L1-like esterase